MFGPTYDAWTAIDDITALKTLTNSARFLNTLPWQGTFVGTLVNSYDLVWPRSGVIVDGVELSSASTPQDVKDALAELAVLVLSNPKITTKADQGNNIRRVGGGGAPEVEYFVPTSAAAGNATVLPPVLNRLLGKYLARPPASAEGGFGAAGGTCSSMVPGRRYDLVRPE